jgi:hypothetical protein
MAPSSGSGIGTGGPRTPGRRPKLTLRGRGRWAMPLAFSVAGGLVAMTLTGLGSTPRASARPGGNAFGQAQGSTATTSLIRQGKQTFRFDTFNDQKFWGGTLGFHKTIEGAKHGGIGPVLSPKEALALGLKVDVNALPKSLQEAIQNGQVNLNDPGVTLALLKLNAVVGVKGIFDSNGN